MMTIDTIKVGEELQAQQNRKSNAAMGVKAAEALLWFDEFGSKEDAAAVLKIECKLIASSTPRAEAAQFYITEVARKFLESILQDAIFNARCDFDNTQAKRRGEGA
jgi:hypothetical protein